MRAFSERLAPGSRVTIRRRAALRLDDGRVVEVNVDEEEVRDGKHIYRRYHFGRPAKSHKDDHRLALYAALHRQDHADVPFEVRLYYPLSGLEQPSDPTARVISNRTGKMAELIRAIEAGGFRPKQSLERCPPCPFNLICPA